MGGKQSKLKKELEALKEDAVQKSKKHEEEMEALRNDKRMLEYKLGVLQELTAQAQMEAEKATQSALESEERMKAMKWELVRKLSVSTAPTSSSSSSTSSAPSSVTAATSLASSSASIPRIPLSWKLRDGVALRRSSTTSLPRLRDDPSGLRSARPHSQSAPAAPIQTLLTQKQQIVSNNQQKETAKQAKPAAFAAIDVLTTELQSVSAPASSDDEASSDASQTRRGVSDLKNSKRPQRRGGSKSKSNDPSEDDDNGSDSSSHSRKQSKSRGKAAVGNLKFSDDEESN